LTSKLQKSFNFVQNGADMNKTDFYSLTPLQHATEFGHIDVVEYLLQAGIVLLSFLNVERSVDTAVKYYY